MGDFHLKGLMMKIWFLFLTVVMVSGNLCAQRDDKRIVTVQIGCTSLAAKQRVLSAFSGSGDWEDIPLSARYLTDPVKLSVSGKKLSFYAPDEQPSPENPVEPLVTIDIPAADRQFLILLFPSGKEKPAYKGVAISSKEFRFGGLCMINASGVPISMTINGKLAKVILPQKSQFLSPRFDGENRAVAVQFFASKSKKPFYSANWNLRKDLREVHFVYLDPRTKRLKIKTIIDMKPAQAVPNR